MHSSENIMRDFFIVLMDFFFKIIANIQYSFSKKIDIIQL